MQLQHATAQAALAAARSYRGQSRKDANCPWTPWAGVDDCSYFQSFIQFGGRPGPIGWCQNWQLVASELGTYHRGNAGVALGDVLLFDWDGNGTANHVGMAAAPANFLGTIATVEANTSAGIAVRDYSRAKKWVMGYFRPNYGYIEQKDDDSMSAADVSELKAYLDAKFAKDNDNLLRDERYRVYAYTENGVIATSPQGVQYMAINDDLPAGDPAKILWAYGGATQVAHWRDPYQLVGDSPAQAKKLDPTSWARKINIARGLDSSQVAPENLPEKGV